MAKIKMKSTSIASEPDVKVPKFNFCQYEPNVVYHNNEEQIDFITDGKSLYVCAIDNYRSSGQIQENGTGFIKIVSQGEPGERGLRGEDGLAGVTPRIDAEFVGEDSKQLSIRINGSRKALSPDLTGPSWKPVVDGTYLSWELTDDKYAPETIDLMTLRPVNDRPILLRTNSDNTKRGDEVSGPANFIQWKYEGDEYWTNLISISELMNLALAGVSFWQAADGKWHFGHREIIRANYSSDKNGRKIISRVDLGDVLFDAGEVPFPDNSVDIELINQRLIALENATPEIDAYTKAQSDAKYQTKGNYAKGIKVNGGTTQYPDDSGIVNLSVSTSSTTDGEHVELRINNGVLQVKYNNGNWQDVGIVGNSSVITMNGFVHVTKDGNTLVFERQDGTTERVTIPSTGGSSVSIQRILNSGTKIATITIDGTATDLYAPASGSNPDTPGSTSLFDVTIQNGHLWKTTDGEHWTDLGQIGDIEENITEEQVKTIIGKILEGVLDSAIPEYVKGSGHNYFVRINELNSILTGYATREWVLQQIVGGGDNDQIVVHSYRTFTIYKWYNIDSNPAIPTLPTSASWDGSSNGLTLVENTNNWTEHPGNRPNDSARLWLATITLLSDGTSSNDWDGPIDLTAYPGKDGNGIEFIYTLCVNEAAYKALTTPQAVVGDGRDDDYPAHWTDQPQGIGTYSAADNIETFYNFTGNENVLFRIEAASIRTSRNGQWNAYCKPFIWSMWGEDGMDGDGIEYIYFLADENKVTESNGQYSLKTDYLPDNSWGYEYQDANSGWTDDPTGTSASYPYEFVSKRKLYEDPATRQPAKTNWSTPALWSTYKEGPEGPIGPDGVTIVSQVRYYKANNQPTGVTAPNESVDPTLSENGSWTTSSNTITLDENSQYLWFFERVVYSNNRIWQSNPVIIRYFNAGTNVNYQEIEDAVEERLGNRLTQLSNRLDSVDKTYADINITSEDALVEILADYVDTDNGNKSFAEIIVDGKGAEIAQAAGLVTSTQMTGVTSRLSAVEGSITNAVDQQTLEGAISSSEQRMTANLISQTVTAAGSKWHKVVNNEDVYENYSPNQGETVVDYNARMIANGWDLIAMVDKMSAIEQKADKVSILVGEDGVVKAGVIVDAINGGNVTIEANKIHLLGETIATAISASEISADQITSGTINANRIGANSIDASKINAENLQVAAANITGRLTASQIDATDLYAKTASFEYLTVNGRAIGTGNSLGIRFGNADTATTEANTIYFLYE